MRAFIFDIDGTLVDSNELHVDSWDRAFRKFGKQFPREALRARAQSRSTAIPLTSCPLR
jgi:membrane protein